MENRGGRLPGFFRSLAVGPADRGTLAMRLLLAAGSTAAFALILFGLAGRLDLPFVWAYLGATALLTLERCLTIDQGLLRERMHPGPGGLDRLSFVLIGLPYLLVLVVAPLDVGRLHIGDQVPPPVQVVGLVAYVAGMGLAAWASAVNRFFSSVIRIQRERGHALVTEGPYARIRHPGYAGGILAIVATPLALGSWLALPFALLAVIAILRRLVIEDRYLHQNLPGYPQYARTVPYRLVPGLW